MWEDIQTDRHYIGRFQVEKSELSGELIYNKKYGFLLLNLQTDMNGFVGKTYHDLKYITGRLNTGTAVTLFGNKCVKNHIRSFQYQIIQFRPRYVVWSRESAAGKKYNALCVIVENGLNWSCLSRLARSDSSITVNAAEEISFNWFDAAVKFSTQFSNECWDLPRKEICKITERLKIVIEVEEKKDIQFFLDIRDKVMAMISFAIKDNVNIERQYFMDYDDFQLLPNSRKEYFQSDILTNEPYCYSDGTDVHDYNFTLRSLRQDDPSLPEKLEKLAPVFNLYLSLFKYENMPVENIFLNIVQALETFHSRFFYGDDKKTYIASVKERFEKSKDYQFIKPLLLSPTQTDENCNYIILVSRLNDLLIGEYDGLFCDFYENGKNYGQRVADTRHYYTHYGKARKKRRSKGKNCLNVSTFCGCCLNTGYASFSA